MVTEGRQRSGGKARIAWREYFERLSSGVNILEKFHLERIFWQQNLRFDKVSYVMVVGLLCIIICYGGFAFKLLPVLVAIASSSLPASDSFEFYFDYRLPPFFY